MRGILQLLKKKYNFLNSAKKNCKNFLRYQSYRKLEKAVDIFNPDIIIHMAAQPLVLPSFEYPKETFEINLMALNILEIIKKFKIKSSIIVTTDKVYKNENKIKYFKETDIIEGSDPYSSSKVDAENLVHCYNKCFFKNKINVVTVRAGNVIGGGDRSEFRIVPDFFRALSDKKTLKIRSPNAVRPWQFVLDPLYGYLLLAKKCYQKKNIDFYSWNFSQKNKKNIKVKEVIYELNNYFKINVKFSNRSNNLMEKKYLNLSSSRSIKNLKWKSLYNMKKTIKQIIEWETYFRRNKKIDLICKKQVNDYFLNLK